MGAFDGLKDAKRGFASNPLREGRYVARIDGCDFFDTEQKGEMWKNTLTILAVEDGDHKPGEVVHTFFKASVGKKVFQQNLKAFIAGVLGAEDEDVDEGVAKRVLSDQNPLAGLVITVSGRRRVSRTKTDDKTGDPVSYVIYSWEPSLSDEEIREALGEEGVARFFPNGL